MLVIRPIEIRENIAIAEIINATLNEYGADVPGTAFSVPSVNHMFEAYQSDNSAYFIAEENLNVARGCGIAPLASNGNNTAELQKMYVAKGFPGRGIGKRLMEVCIEFAYLNNYAGIYLETLPHMKEAGRLYSGFGFTYLSKRMGKTGHNACHVWMYKEL